jgi:hypothetical protein
MVFREIVQGSISHGQETMQAGARDAAEAASTYLRPLGKHHMQKM